MAYMSDKINLYSPKYRKYNQILNKKTTNSPIKNENRVAMLIANTIARAEIVLSSSPNPESHGVAMRVKAGSAKNPVSKVVRVMPSWAAERWVEVLAIALIGRSRPFCPDSLRASSSMRSVLISENSDATKSPVPMVSRTPRDSSNRSLIALSP